MHGDLLDLFLILACLGFAISGYRQGLLVGALSFLGIFGGGLVGTRIAAPVSRALGDRFSAPVVGIAVVFICASIGQVLAAAIGARIKGRLTWRPLRLLDSAGGGALSVVSVLLVAWLLATAVAHSSLTGLSRQVRASVVIGAVDNVVPGIFRSDLARFRRLLDNTGFPAVVGPLTSEAVLPVAPPDAAIAGSAAVRTARASILKVRGDAPSCGRRIEGSGFVYAPGRLMTNAHVVAGVRRPEVEVGSRTLSATVVLYDPQRDVAVLDVPGLTATPLAFGGVAGRGATAIVAGYPQDGPFTAGAARIRDRQEIRGPNIYMTRDVTRQVYAVRALVRPGNSGGPLLTPAGQVYGVVFAASTDTADTGYALTAAEVASDASRGRSGGSRVSTGGCD